MALVEWICAYASGGRVSGSELRGYLTFDAARRLAPAIPDVLDDAFVTARRA
jgi:hypothetical protein